MPLVEDDAEVNPTIATAQLNYIRYLTDTHKQYTRFLDALLVPRPSHAAFFRDLKAFRLQPTTIKTLSQCDPDGNSTTKEQRQELYKDVTAQYLASRFAHPWCRKAMAGTGNTKGGGWWGAEWSGTGRRMSKEHEESQQKLHKLLVPLWVCFRGRMFPGSAIVDEWWETRQREMPVAQASSHLDIASPDSVQVQSRSGQKNLRMATSTSDLKHGYMVAEGDDYDDDDDDDEQQQRRVAGEGQQAASVATGILRLAAAGMIINSMPKMQKWKLRRELRKR